MGIGRKTALGLTYIWCALRKGGATTGQVFFAWSTALFHGHESCDCFRLKVATHLRHKHKPMENRIQLKLSRDYLETMTENRYYRHAENGIAVTFLWWGKFASRGHWRWVGTASSSPPASRLPCQAGWCSGPPVWLGEIPELLDSVVADLHPTDLVLSRGWDPITHEQLRKIANSALVRRNNETHALRSLIWKTSSIGSNREPPEPSHVYARTYLEQRGWNILDAYALSAANVRHPKAEFLDYIHFHCRMYNLFNSHLLKLLGCGNYNQDRNRNGSTTTER